MSGNSTRLGVGLATGHWAAVGTVLGLAQATDPAGLSLRYALTDDAGGRFTINAETGQISLGTAIDYSYLAASRYTLTVTVTNDNPSLFSVQPAISGNGTPSIRARRSLLFQSSGVSSCGFS